MDEYVILAASLKLGYALVAALGLVAFTRWLDRRAGARFADIASVIRGQAMPAALYSQCRIK